MFAIKLSLIIATLWMTAILFRGTLIVPKSMDLKVKALLLICLIPQILNLAINFAPISLQVSSFFYFLNFFPLNAFIYLQFEVLHIFRYNLLLKQSVLCDWWNPVFMPRVRLIVMCAHLITASCLYVGLFIRVSGNTNEFSGLFRPIFTLSQIIGPSIYVIYTAIQSAYISYWISQHMLALTSRAENRGQNLQSGDWMPRFRRLYWIQMLLLAADITAIASAVLANIIARDPWWALDDVAVSVVYVECLAIGYIFIELRGICLTLNVNNEIEVQKRGKLKLLGRGVKVIELDTVRISGSPRTPIAGNPKTLIQDTKLLVSAGSSGNGASNSSGITPTNVINSKSTGAGSDTATQLIESRQGRA